MLPPGRDRLCTRPSPTGSATATNTIGMVAVADFRATAACGPATTSTSGLESNRSATEAGSRSGLAEKRYSIIRFFPRSSRARAAHRTTQLGLSGLAAATLPRKPTRRGVPCAHERRGETSSAAVAAMNSRRFIRSSSQLEETGAEYQVSMVVALTAGANAGSKRGVAHNSYRHSGRFCPDATASL